MAAAKRRDTLVTLTEAAAITGVRLRTLSGWNASGKLRPVRRHTTGRRQGLYDRADVERLASELADVPRPEGYVSLSEAATLLAMRRDAVRNAVSAGKIRSVPGRVNGRSCRWVLAADCVRAKPLPGNTNPARKLAVEDPIALVAATAGHELTSLDRAVLASRQERMARFAETR